MENENGRQFEVQLGRFENIPLHKDVSNEELNKPAEPVKETKESRNEISKAELSKTKLTDNLSQEETEEKWITYKFDQQ